MSAPAWLDSAIFYEIYPQSFCDSNGDGIGDIPGIITKLDYIRDLGATAIWLNPCFLSPFADAGYDVADYCRVAPRYGTNEDLIRLFREAHARGLRVILDLVPGHTSIEHPWFRSSMAAEENEYSKRYIWTDSIWESPEGMHCLRGISARDGSVAVNFFSSQPALNYGYARPDPVKPWQDAMDAPGPLATREAIQGVMRFWLDAGCDGFRVDMAGSLVKGEGGAEGTISLWQDFFDFLNREYPEAAMVSEWGEPDKSLRAGFHMDFLLHFGPSHYNDLFRVDEPYFSRRGRGSLAAFWKAYARSRAKAGTDGLICIPSGNHDMDRLARRLEGDDLALAFAFLLTMPGVPFIYYGDEIGQKEVEGLISVEGGYGRTGARSPMHWDRTQANAGFSAAASDALYIAMDSSPDHPDVASQEGMPSSLLNTVRALCALRKSVPALGNRGEFKLISGGGYPLVYLRGAGPERVLVAINPSEKQFTCKVPPLTGAATLWAYGGTSSLSRRTLTIPGRSAVVIQAPSSTVFR